ncbi:hypothetical protein ACFLU5_16920 [Bacteroidota bacterium]
MENERQKCVEDFIHLIKKFPSDRICCSDDDIISLCLKQLDLDNEISRDEYKKLFQDFFNKLNDHQQYLYNKYAAWKMKPRVERPSNSLIGITNILKKCVGDGKELKTASQFAKEHGITPHQFNTMLVKNNVIRKNGRKCEFTISGKKYGEDQITVDGVKVKVENFRYYESVIDLLKSNEFLEADEYKTIAEYFVD